MVMFVVIAGGESSAFQKVTNPETIDLDGYPERLAG